MFKLGLLRLNKVNTRHHIAFILFIINSLSVMAADDELFYSNKVDHLPISLSKDKEIKYSDWIKTENNHSFSFETNKDITFGDELSLKWNLSHSLTVNLSVFESQSNNNFKKNPILSSFNSGKGKSLITQQPKSLDVNQNITSYKLGLSSAYGIGSNYTLNINFDYGQIVDADLVGFNSQEVSTTSFALGIRKAKFGASLNTDMYLEDDIDLKDHSRLGLELDWYFSDDTTISVGTKQRINSNSYIDRSNSIDNLTGNVQYIKFQHNL